MGSRPSLTGPIGIQVRTLRKLRGLSLEDVSRRSGVSLGLLSQLERGAGNPSLATLEAIASSLVVPVTSLLAGKPLVSPVVRKDERSVLDIHPGRDTGTRHELLTPSLDGTLQVVEVILPAHYAGPDEPFSHTGEEFGTVLSGEVEVLLDGERHALAVGDSITYLASTPHSYRNPTGRAATVMWIVTPPAF